MDNSSPVDTTSMALDYLIQKTLLGGGGGGGGSEGICEGGVDLQNKVSCDKMMSHKPHS